MTIYLLSLLSNSHVENVDLPVRPAQIVSAPSLGVILARVGRGSGA